MSPTFSRFLHRSRCCHIARSSSFVQPSHLPSFRTPTFLTLSTLTRLTLRIPLGWPYQSNFSPLLECTFSEITCKSERVSSISQRDLGFVRSDLVSEPRSSSPTSRTGSKARENAMYKLLNSLPSPKGPFPALIRSRGTPEKVQFLWLLSLKASSHERQLPRGGHDT